MKILLVDEWGAGNSIRIANDMAATGASVYILREFEFNVRVPGNVCLLPPVSLASGDVVAAIERAVYQVSPDVVMPAEEATLLQIWEQRPSWLSLVQPRIDLTWLACYRDKHEMLTFAADQGVPIPETYVPVAAENSAIGSLIEKLGLPIVIKGASGSSGEQVRIATTQEEALRFVDEIYAVSGIAPALQKFIKGCPYQVGGLFVEGRPVCFLAAEKTEILPAMTGPAIELVSRRAPELADYSEKILSSLGYSGIAGLDFIRDSEGRFYFLEVNPRIWGSYGMVRALGMDLFDAWYRYLQDEEQPVNLNYPDEVKWAKMPEYLFADPRTAGNILKRMCRPIAIQSLAWRQPYLLLHQLRRIYWELRR